VSEVFVLPPEVTIYSVMETRDALLAWAEKERAQGSDALQVSAEQVAQIDGAGLQLLASLGNLDVTWQLSQTSDAFSEACRTLGLNHWLTGQARTTDAVEGKS
jgi:ABC-type transporter Mla MlaB component